MSVETGVGMHTNADRLVRVETKLDIVIEQHTKDIAENKLTSGSAHTRVDALSKQVNDRIDGVVLQQNTHEVKIAQLWEKSVGAFGKLMMGISGMVGVAGLITVWLR